MIWPREKDYNKIIDGMALGYGVPAPLIKGIIAKESSFKPDSIKQEPQIQDASRGLMQILYRTAKNLGFPGEANQLFEPGINILFGTRLLAENLKRSQKTKIPNPTANAIAAYNAGWSKKFPGWAPRKPDLTYVNQEYVDTVNVYTAYFAGRLTEKEVRTFQKTKAAPSSTLFF